MVSDTQAYPGTGHRQKSIPKGPRRVPKRPKQMRFGCRRGLVAVSFVDFLSLRQASVANTLSHLSAWASPTSPEVAFIKPWHQAIPGSRAHSGAGARVYPGPGCTREKRVRPGAPGTPVRNLLSVSNFPDRPANQSENVVRLVAHRVGLDTIRF